jgi:uncharacterized membrane protein YvlD (DUF360 family)
MEKLFWTIVSSLLTVFLATKFIGGVSVEIIPGESNYFGFNFTKDWQMKVFIGLVLAFISFVVISVFNIVALPLKFFGFGFLAFFVDLAIIWFLDVIFPELKIVKLSSLLLTTLLFWFLNSLFRI